MYYFAGANKYSLCSQ
jgi:AT-rich interactive domain-containing protein 2